MDYLLGLRQNYLMRRECRGELEVIKFEVYAKNRDGWFETHYYGEKCDYEICGDAHPYLKVVESLNLYEWQTIAVFAHGCWQFVNAHPKEQSK